MLSNIAEIDVENDDVVLILSKVVQISIKIDINVVNSDLPKAFPNVRLKISHVGTSHQPNSNVEITLILLLSSLLFNI